MRILCAYTCIWVYVNTHVHMCSVTRFCTPTPTYILHTCIWVYVNMYVHIRVIEYMWTLMCICVAWQGFAPPHLHIYYMRVFECMWTRYVHIGSVTKLCASHLYAYHMYSNTRIRTYMYSNTLIRCIHITCVFLSICVRTYMFTYTQIHVYISHACFWVYVHTLRAYMQCADMCIDMYIYTYPLHCHNMHVYVWNDSFVCHSVWHASCTCRHVRHDSFMCHSVWHDSFVCHRIVVAVCCSVL